MSIDAAWTMAIAILATTNCALIGTYLVLRKMAMMGDAIAHAILPGVVVGLVVTGSKSMPSLLLGALATGLIATFLIAFLEKKLNVQTDAAIGINFTFLFSCGVIMISFLSRKIDLDPECSLYGQLEMAPFHPYQTNQGVILGPRAFYVLSLSLVVNFIFLMMSYRHLLVTTFDPAFAQTIGINPIHWHYVLMMMTSLTTVAAFEVAGVILVVAFLIVPAASISLVAKSLKDILFFNVIFTTIVSIGGYYFSLVCDSSMASAMVTLSGLFFLLIFIFQAIRPKQHN